MRGAMTFFAVLVFGGLAACSGQPGMIDINAPAEATIERRDLCLANQIKAADYTLPSFERQRAREQFNQDDCVYRPVPAA